MRFGDLFSPTVDPYGSKEIVELREAARAIAESPIGDDDCVDERFLKAISEALARLGEHGVSADRLYQDVNDLRARAGWPHALVSRNKIRRLRRALDALPGVTD